MEHTFILHSIFPSPVGMENDFRNLSPEDFCKKHPKVLVADAYGFPTSHPGYNSYYKSDEFMQQCIEQGFTIEEIKKII